MFRASSAHLQEVSDGNCTCMLPLVFSFSARSSKWAFSFIFSEQTFALQDAHLSRYCYMPSPVCPLWLNQPRVRYIS